MGGSFASRITVIGFQQYRSTKAAIHLMYSICRSLALASTAALALAGTPFLGARAEEPRPLSDNASEKNLADTKPSTNQTNRKVLVQRTGWYGTLALGAVKPQDQSAHVLTHYGYEINGSIQRQTGFSGEVGIGYDFGDIRAEVTYGYTRNDLISAQASAMGIDEKTAGLSGTTTTQKILANLYWDIKTKSKFTPYIGGGIGYGAVHQSATTFQMASLVHQSGTGYGQADTSDVLAYQGKIGIGYMTTPNLEIFLEGVYQGNTGYYGESGFTPNPGSNGNSNAWGANLGFRYKLGKN
jgi:opacity protein-like surface antigen